MRIEVDGVKRQDPPEDDWAYDTAGRYAHDWRLCVVVTVIYTASGY